MLLGADSSLQLEGMSATAGGSGLNAQKIWKGRKGESDLGSRT